VITDAFQGELEVWTEGGTGSAASAPLDPSTGLPQHKTERVPFLMLGLELPQAPLFKDTFERLIIPQVPLFSLLKKFNGETIHDDVRAGENITIFL
jgi:U4/U6.U5 tri-snRNP-associated protein 2